MSNEISIKIDLWHDYASMIKHNLSHRGFNTNGIINDDDIIISYLNLLKRSVSCTQRKILKSNNFNCPPEFTTSLSTIENLIKNGLDITPYLSKKINELDYNDAMMNDWGIHHLHLGEQIENGFIKRTGKLLFVKFTHDYAYFVGIYDHRSWTCKSIIETIHSNWCDVIKKHKCENIIDLSYEPNENDIKNFRENGINTAITLDDGSIYMTLGGGYSVNGTSTEAVMEMLHKKRILKDAERQVKQYVNDNESKFNVAEELIFSLGMNETSFFVTEISNQSVRYKLFNL